MVLSGNDGQFLAAMMAVSGTVAALLLIVYQMQWQYFDSKPARKKLVTARRTRSALAALVVTSIGLLFPLILATSAFVEDSMMLGWDSALIFLVPAVAGFMLILREIGTSINYVFTFMLVQESGLDPDLKLGIAERIEESSKVEIDSIVQAVKGGEKETLRALVERLGSETPPA